MRSATILCGLVAVLLVAGAARLAYIGGTQGPDLRAQAARQQTVRWQIPARRGEILDTRGRVLAGTLYRPSVFVDPGRVRDARFTAYSVAPILGLDAAALERDLLAWRGKTRFRWLKRLISDDELAALERLLEARQLGAVVVQFEPTRIYPQQARRPLAPHLLGFVGADMQGLWGIEAGYDDVLRGQPVEYTATVDSRREPVRVPAANGNAITDGATLVLTIDAYVQEVTQDALRSAVEEHRAAWGTAVVMDPWSGEVLAMATVPEFDPADPIPSAAEPRTEAEKEALDALWRNRAVTDAYEPGSIFKPFIVACAIEDGIARLDESFQINGPDHSFGGRVIHDTHPYDQLELREVVSHSSNIGMGMLGARCGCNRLHEYVRGFGFGSVSGIGLPGESAGLVLPLEQWNPRYSPQSVPIGQEIGATPVQIATAFGVFANGGLLMKPRVVRGIIGPEGQTIEDWTQPEVVRRVLDDATVRAFREQALVAVVNTGTGTKAQLPGWQVFGKTGTAQVARVGGRGYEPGAYVGSFVGGAPADEPRAVVLVSLYKPSAGKYYGGTVAAPAVAAILAETLAYMQVPPAAPDAVEMPRAARRK